MKPISTILYEIAEYAIEVQQTLAVGAPNPSPRSDRTIRTVPGPRPPLDLDAIDLLRDDPLDELTIGKGAAPSHLIDRLGLCVRMIAEERNLAGLTAPEPAYGTWAGPLGYLASTASWWLAEPGLNTDIEHELRQIHTTLERAARVPHAPTYQCDRCNAPAHPQAGGQWMLCEAGHQVEGLGAVRDRIKRARPLTAQEIEDQWGVKAATIRRWKSRGLLAPVGRSGNRDTWSVWDVLTVQHREQTGAVA